MKQLTNGPLCCGDQYLVGVTRISDLRSRDRFFWFRPLRYMQTSVFTHHSPIDVLTALPVSVRQLSSLVQFKHQSKHINFKQFLKGSTFDCN